MGYASTRDGVEEYAMPVRSIAQLQKREHVCVWRERESRHRDRETERQRDRETYTDRQRGRAHVTGTL
eukprot:2675896-Rhodomonas_salina.1